MNFLAHLYLAHHWPQFTSGLTLAQFSAAAEREIVPHLAAMPAEFQQLNAVMWRERWFEHYDQLEALFFIFYPRLMTQASARTL